MGILEIAAILLTLAAVLSYVNYQYFKLPTTIGLMILTMSLSLVVLVINSIFPGVGTDIANVVRGIDFNQALMNGMLAFLLFAGALHIKFNDLGESMLEITIFSTIGVVGSAVIVAGLTWLLAQWIALPLTFMHCLLFGALISPTDPIAVMGLLKQAKAPKSLENQLAGESLFNDGIGVVVFLVLFSVVYPGDGHATFGWTKVLEFFALEALGGIVFGFVLGWITFQMLKNVDDYRVEVLITLGSVMGGYTLANALHTSGPLAIVVVGILIGNHGRKYAMSQTTIENLDTFWELIDEILNAVLFVLIGAEVLVLNLTGQFILAGLIAIPICLLARFISIGAPIAILRLKRTYSRNIVKVLTWAGLRGGIPVALALALPAGPERNVILTITYSVVAFSIIVQGLTVKRLLEM